MPQPLRGRDRELTAGERLRRVTRLGADPTASDRIQPSARGRTAIARNVGSIDGRSTASVVSTRTARAGRSSDRLVNDGRRRVPRAPGASSARGRAGLITRLRRGIRNVLRGAQRRLNNAAERRRRSG